jgi:hypothetical protein
MSKQPIQWVTRWSIRMSAKPVLPGVWKRKDGGHVVRARVVNPKSGRQVEILKVLADETDPKRALAWLTSERDRVRRGRSGAAQTIPTFKQFALSVFRSKVDDRTIHTASGRKKWARILEHHLCTAPWATYFVDRVSHADLVEWRGEIARMGWERHVPSKDGTPRLAASGDRYSPNTLNDWLGIARVIWKAATHTYELGRNPMDGVEDFATDHHRTYTKEEPNALTPAEASGWLETFKEMFPQHYAMTFLGLVLGHRPSTLRPLRRSGKSADLDFSTGRILIRRSNTESDEVEDFTKTKKDQDIPLPKSVLDVLRWHVDTQMETWQMRKSDLLFPTRDGGFRSRSCLDKPFAAVTKACGIDKRITPKALRRTFQDISREAKVEGVVAKAITGHSTDAMRLLYSTAQDAEVEKGIARVVNIASRRPRKQRVS